MSRAAGVREARRLVNRSHADWEDEMLGHAHDLGHAAGVEAVMGIIEGTRCDRCYHNVMRAIRGLKGGGDGE